MDNVMDVAVEAMEAADQAPIIRSGNGVAFVAGAGTATAIILIVSAVKKHGKKVIGFFKKDKLDDEDLDDEAADDESEE